MNETTGITMMNTLLTFTNHHLMLKWAEEHLDAPTYQRILKSYKAVIRNCAIIIVAWLILLCGAVFWAFSAQSAYMSDYSSIRTGRVQGDTIYYIDNIKYEINPSDYGYNTADYSAGSKFRIYFDQNDKIVRIRPEAEVNSLMEDDLLWIVILLGGGLILPIVLLVIFVPVALKTFGRDWHAYGIWYQRHDAVETQFKLPE